MAVDLIESISYIVVNKRLLDHVFFFLSGQISFFFPSPPSSAFICMLKMFALDFCLAGAHLSIAVRVGVAVMSQVTGHMTPAAGLSTSSEYALSVNGKKALSSSACSRDTAYCSLDCWNHRVGRCYTKRNMSCLRFKL